ncbi:MAG TPA: tripartite tricarboxylate transporter substrate binding protein [Burkholderiales bacterium]|nr:tripartite tricarboxylate transporter substrate binding protein [Burkholderiales bacterium]
MSRLLVAVLLALGAAAAQAQADYPNKPIRLVIGYAAGGPTDAVGRMYAGKLSEYLGVQVIVDNRAGAAGIIGTEIVAKARPDGYTLLLGVISTHGLHPAHGQKLPYDAVRDFAPVALAVNVPMVIVVNPKVLPVTSVKGLIEELKANPGKHRFGSSGNGGISHMCFELFKQRTGVKEFTHVPYKGTGPAITDLISGNISAVCEGVGGAAGHVRSGTVRGIATAALKRAQALPDLPTVAESALPGFEAYTWNMFFAPAQTPRAIVERLNREINRAAKDPALRPKLDALGVEVVDNSTPESLRDFVPREIEKWKTVVKASGVKADQ